MWHHMPCLLPLYWYVTSHAPLAPPLLLCDITCPACSPFTVMWHHMPRLLSLYCYVTSHAPLAPPLLLCDITYPACSPFTVMWHHMPRLLPLYCNVNRNVVSSDLWCHDMSVKGSKWKIWYESDRPFMDEEQLSFYRCKYDFFIH